MPTAVTETPYRPVPLGAPVKRWTRADCKPLEASGVWGREKLELVDGQLISKMGKNRPHVITLSLLLAKLVAIFGEHYVNPKAPIDVAPSDNPTNETEPDIIVLARPMQEFGHNPTPPDLRLVVEVSDTTLGFDLTTKAALYARAGIIEYWVVDIPARRLVVHREPQNGAFRSVAVYAEHEVVCPLAAPGREMQLAGVLPPA